MKHIFKITVFLMVAMLAIPISMACTGPNCTATSNGPINSSASTMTWTSTPGTYPTLEEVTRLIAIVNNEAGSQNKAELLFRQVEADHSTWKTDRWTNSTGKDVTCVYYADGSSYKSYYIDANGNEIQSPTGLTIADSYKGDGVGKFVNDNTTTATVPETTSTVSNSTGTCTGPNCTQNSSVSSCPNCQKTAQTANETQTSNALSINGTTYTAEQQNEITAFRNYFNGKTSVTVEEIVEEAIKCFILGGK